MTNRIVPAANLPRLKEKVAALQKRARKLGLPEIGLVIDGEMLVTHKDPLGFETKELHYTCHIIGESPRISGWRLLGVVQPQPTGENLLRMIPGCECPLQYRSTTMICDHCQTTRRRSLVCILEHEDGRTQQVGRNCLKDFLGHSSPESLLRSAQVLWKIDSVVSEAGEDGWGGMGGGTYGLPAETFLATVSLMIRRFGWVSRSQAKDYQQSTADLAWNVQSNRNNPSMTSFIKECSLYAKADDVELARKTLEWAKDLDLEVKSDYLYNLGVVARTAVVTGIVDYKNCGVLASAITAYQRDNERKTAGTGTHVGTVNKREVFRQVTVNSVRAYEGSYGMKYLVNMTDANGNHLIWFASVEPDSAGLALDKTVDIKATVKRHSVYMNTPQTELQRVVVVEEAS